MNLQEKLQSLGYELPTPAPPAANYIPYTIANNLVFIAGQIPFLNGREMHKGCLGQTMDLEQGIEAARACALNILAQANHAVGGEWKQISKCLKLGGFVACTPDFTDHPKVMNGASELIVAVMGDAGKHARFAVGAPSLPLGCAVEIDAVFEIA